MIYILLALLGGILPFVFGIYRYKILSWPYRLIFFQVIIAKLCETYGFYLIGLKKHNAWLFNLYYLPEFWLLGIAGGSMVFGPRYWATYVLPASATIVWLLNVRAGGIGSTVTWAVLYASMLFVVLFTVVLYRSGNDGDANVFKMPDFWIGLGHILYFALNIPLFGLLNYLINENMRLAKNLFLISDITGVVRYILIGIGFSIVGKQSTS